MTAVTDGRGDARGVTGTRNETGARGVVDNAADSRNARIEASIARWEAEQAKRDETLIPRLESLRPQRDRDSERAKARFSRTFAAAGGDDDLEDDERAYRDRRSLELLMRRESREHCGWCGCCGRELGPDDPVQRRTVDGWLTPVCLTLCADTERAWRACARPCLQCGRDVQTTSWRASRPFCCDRCRREWSNLARRVERTSSACLSCGESFTPSRADARYCSGACRQRAYRGRVKS